MKLLISAGTLAITLITVLATPALSKDVPPPGLEGIVDDRGNIRLPAVDFRAKWPVLGAFSIAGDTPEGGAAGLHVVYTQPGVIESYRKTGKFPDGAVLIKELLKTKTKQMTTGRVSHATERAGWFVMVKDATGRFKDNKLWGDGWGWAFFGSKDRVKTPTKDYKAECLGCHIPAKKNDWIYVEGYPALKN